MKDKNDVKSKTTSVSADESHQDQPINDDEVAKQATVISPTKKVGRKRKPKMMRVFIESIEIGERIRTPTKEQVDIMVESIKMHGLLSPPLVRTHPTIPGKKELIDGNTRIQALKKSGETEIDVVVREMDDAAKLMSEIDSNIVGGLTELQLGEHLAAREIQYLIKYPETKKGGDARKKKLNDNLTFTQDTAKSTSIHQRKIQRMLEIGKGIQKKYRELLHTKEKIADNATDLKCFVNFAKKYDDKAQGEVVNMALAEEKSTLKSAIENWKKLNGEIKELTQKEIEENEIKIVSKIQELWASLTFKGQKQAFDNIVNFISELKPNDRIFTLRDAMNLSIDDAAKSAGIDTASWESIENGETDPRDMEPEVYLPLILGLDKPKDSKKAA